MNVCAVTIVGTVLNLQNVKLSAKPSAGDMVALEAKYHKSYLTTVSNKPHSTRLKAAKEDDDEKIDSQNCPCRINLIHRGKSR